jgi:hypothetical protein
VLDTVRGTVYDTVRDTVGGTVLDTVRGTVNDTVNGTVYGTVGGTVAGTVEGTVRDTVAGTVGRTVAGTVGHAVRGDWSHLNDADAALVQHHRQTVQQGWTKYLSGWWSWWQARNGFCIEVLGAAPEMRERLDAWKDACSAGMWWPHTDFVIVSERPVAICHTRIGPDGWGSHQLHNETGPAIKWADGWSIWCWHGITVPQWVIEHPTPERIAAEPNTEIRRCAIESYGWARYLTDLDVRHVDEQDDPGNPGHKLRLFDIPDDRLFDGDVRLLVMENASRDRDGSRRTFAETVPASCATAIEAAAWQFGVAPDVYAQMARAT